MDGRNRTENAIMQPDEAVPVDRYQSPFITPAWPAETSSGSSDPAVLRSWTSLQEQWNAGYQQRFRTRGRILDIFLGPKRQIRFGRNGPRLAEMEPGQFLIADPVLELPPTQMLDSRGRMKTAVPKLEQYASRIASGLYVLEPLAEILYADPVEQGEHLHYLYFGSDAAGNLPGLLYEPKNRRLLIYGQGVFQST